MKDDRLTKWQRLRLCYYCDQAHAALISMAHIINDEMNPKLSLASRRRVGAAAVALQEFFDRLNCGCALDDARLEQEERIAVQQTLEAIRKENRKARRIASQRTPDAQAGRGEALRQRHVG